MPDKTTVTAAYLFDCPWCGVEATGLIDLVADDEIGLRASNPRMVIDTHVMESPVCPLRKYASSTT